MDYYYNWYYNGINNRVLISELLAAAYGGRSGWNPVAAEEEVDWVMSMDNETLPAGTNITGIPDRVKKKAEAYSGQSHGRVFITRRICGGV